MRNLDDLFLLPLATNIAYFNHIGIATHSIESTLNSLNLGCINDIEMFDDYENDVRVAFIKMFGVPYELVEPISDASPVSKQMMNNSLASPYHVCIEPLAGITNEQIYNELINSGFSEISKPKPAVAFYPRKIQWFISPKLGLLELILSA